MAEFERRISQVSVPVVFVASLALLSLLAFNLRNLDPGTEELPPPVAGGGSRPGEVIQEGAGEGLRALYLVVFASFVGIVAVGVILMWRKGVKPWQLISPWELLAYGIAVSLIVGILVFWPAIQRGLEGLLGVGGDATSEPGAPGTPPFLPTGSPSSILLILAVLLLTAYVAIFAFVFLPRMYGVVTLPAPTSDRRRKELARTVRRAIADLESGEEFRAAVLRCYKSMVFLFEGHGIRPDPSQTAREFESEALQSMGVSREGIDDLTSLFEEARYSTHPIREAQRDASIACLESIRSQLEGAPSAG